jgi:hypothetical protein
MMDNLSFFNEIYYPQIQKEKKPKTYEREESFFRLWIDKNIGKQTFEEITKGDIESIFYNMVLCFFLQPGCL